LFLVSQVPALQFGMLRQALEARLFLRPLLRSYNAMGAQPLDNVTLPPFGVYIGELRL